MEFKAELYKIPLKVENGNYILSFNLGKDSHIAYDLYEQYMKAPVKVNIEKYNEKRTDEQNRMFWACISQLATALGLDNHETYLRELKRYGKFTSIIIKSEAIKDLEEIWREIDIIGKKKDEKGIEYYEVLSYYGTSTYNTKEFAHLLSGVLEDMKDIGLDTEYLNKPTEKNVLENK